MIKTSIKDIKETASSNIKFIRIAHQTDRGHGPQLGKLVIYYIFSTSVHVMSFFFSRNKTLQGPLRPHAGSYNPCINLPSKVME